MGTVKINNFMGQDHKEDDDQDLINRDSPEIRGSTPAGKVAFMFLTKGSLPMAPLWEKFFEKHKGNFSVYVHTHPHYNWTLSKDSVFYGSIIPSKVSSFTTIYIIIRTFNEYSYCWNLVGGMGVNSNALLEPTNQRFVLLSESCIPLFNFPTIYSYLMGSAQNFVEAFNQPGPSGIGRYKRSFTPLVFPAQWLKGSQWFTINRNLATTIVLDSEYFPRFKNICGSTTCHADEHYLPTFVNLRFAHQNSNWSLAWVDWSGGGMHPRSFFRTHVTVEFLKGLRNVRSCEYNEEKRAVCCLFARKFLPNSLVRLMKFAPKMMRF
ncbi:glycosyltransferase BC10-like [Impatiens glandulifera]|uniref:glycosyltransferase BC10-like n=1 Tax=Impatiens glandulifera TaxID=253017 RepID=UPI001FB0D901|nr:glycosyltransferase BC10-like [Impatiens glandulifera]